MGYSLGLVTTHWSEPLNLTSVPGHPPGWTTFAWRTWIGSWGPRRNPSLASLDIRIRVTCWTAFCWMKSYCWWLKSCTTWDVWNPINNGIFIISTGAGFLPSTVVWLVKKKHRNRFIHFWNSAGLFCWRQISQPGHYFQIYVQWIYSMFVCFGSVRFFSSHLAPVSRDNGWSFTTVSEVPWSTVMHIQRRNTRWAP